MTTIDSLESSHAADGARRRESHESRVTSHTEKGTAAPSENGATPNRRRVTVIGVALSRDRDALGAGKKTRPGYQFSPESPADVGELKTSHRRRREAREEARSNASAGRRVGDETDGSTGERKDDAPRRRRRARACAAAARTGRKPTSFWRRRRDREKNDRRGAAYRGWTHGWDSRATPRPRRTTEKDDRDGRPIHRHRASFARATDDSRGPVRRLLLALRV